LLLTAACAHPILAHSLTDFSLSCCSPRAQADRTKALADFKAGTVPLLVATDVAARGLDIPNVECVKNET
jgi:ATP-dependent RNA helicase DBP3